jgi:hypothetical protein
MRPSGSSDGYRSTWRLSSSSTTSATGTLRTLRGVLGARRTHPGVERLQLPVNRHLSAEKVDPVPAEAEGLALAETEAGADDHERPRSLVAFDSGWWWVLPGRPRRRCPDGRCCPMIRHRVYTASVRHELGHGASATMHVLVQCWTDDDGHDMAEVAVRRQPRDVWGVPSPLRLVHDEEVRS